MRFDISKVKVFFSKLFFEVFSIELEDGERITIEDEYTLSTLFDLFDTQDENEISDIIFSCENCSQSFLKGVFLACGMLSDPAKSYHLEFATIDDERARALFDYFSLQGLNFKLTHRRGKPVLYSKSVETLEMFFSYIGASVAIFAILNAKMIGEARNSINRLTNFENANLNRTVTASVEQVSAAKHLIETGAYQLLPHELKETVTLRIDYPDISLAALAAKHNPPITKSGLNNRLRKIIKIAQEDQ
jgi:DNA-binding protein WhiA